MDESKKSKLYAICALFLLIILTKVWITVHSGAAQSSADGVNYVRIAVVTPMRDTPHFSWRYESETAKYLTDLNGGSQKYVLKQTKRE